MGKARPLDEVKAANVAAIAKATAAAWRAGIPYFEADNVFVYAVYPDGHRAVVEKVKPLVAHRDEKPA
jgi:hypothetical protein